MNNKPEKNTPPNPFGNLGKNTAPKPKISEQDKKKILSDARNASGYKPGVTPKPPAPKADMPKVNPPKSEKPKSIKATKVSRRRKRAAPPTEVFSGRLEPATINELNDYADETGLPMREVIKRSIAALKEKDTGQ